MQKCEWAGAETRCDDRRQVLGGVVPNLRGREGCISNHAAGVTSIASLAAAVVGGLSLSKLLLQISFIIRCG